MSNIEHKKCITINTDDAQSKQMCEDSHGIIKDVFLSQKDIVIQFDDKSDIRHDLVHVNSIVVEMDGKEKMFEPQKIGDINKTVKEVKKEIKKRPSKYMEQSKQRFKQNLLKSFFSGLFKW